MIVCSFPPVARADAEILILGSMPGPLSLARQQYYAHPQNLFWPFMGEIFGAGPDKPYESRLELLQARGIALWDVLKECFRESALDADIVENSIIPNDFPAFFAEHPGIKRVFFNGSKAEQAFRRYVLPTLEVESLELVRLPSTSPANASVTRENKLAEWRRIRPVSA
ncbi:DNA-deoxyinosine glycosylase [Novimethylophilus kurashikiensis]|uniref:DNA-deoxyinosine glycosylase n=1 Tax=Novimethylophilus kurashikiensis TaxID=1825523 RepID=A0A2R5F8D3_9PROT|nr:DNA-deoxyinosine glycosylase [Novimethylophilus kurashikiensis]GBG13818.1 DNA-deoxyinosine glycosylase [Novimethylophilus kurashikiensis]